MKVFASMCCHRRAPTRRQLVEDAKRSKVTSDQSPGAYAYSMNIKRTTTSTFKKSSPPNKALQDVAHQESFPNDAIEEFLIRRSQLPKLEWSMTPSTKRRLQARRPLEPKDVFWDSDYSLSRSSEWNQKTLRKRLTETALVGAVSSVPILGGLFNTFVALANAHKSASLLNLGALALQGGSVVALAASSHSLALSAGLLATGGVAGAAAHWMGSRV